MHKNNGIIISRELFFTKLLKKKPETMFSGGKGAIAPHFGTFIFNRPEKGAGV